MRALIDVGVRVAGLGLAAYLSLGTGAVARVQAQDAAPAGEAVPAEAPPEAMPPEDVQSAAAAFGEGQRAQVRGDYGQAADMFELADRSAPSAAALRSAIRNRRAAGHLARAATLARDAQRRYPADADTAALAAEVLAEATPRLASIRVTCAPACSLAIDRRAAGPAASTTFELFVDPGARTLVASWSGREPVTRSIDAVAGAEQTLALEAPAIAEPEPVTEPEPDARSGPIDEVIVRPAPPPSDSGISPAFFGVSAGVTAVLGAVAIWSGVDTLDARDRYVADPTRAGYEDGVGRQWRTNGLLIGVGVLAITTVVLAIVTDWDGAPSSEPEGSSGAQAVVPWMTAGGEGAAIGLSGTFGGSM